MRDRYRGCQGVARPVAMLYHHTVVPNWAVRIAGDQGLRQVYSAKSKPHEVDAEIRPIGGVID
jgi:hypothetical protein